MVIDKAKKVRKTHVRITHVNFHRLCEWVKQPGKVEGVKYFEDVCKRAEEELGFPVAVGTIREALQVTGVQMPETSYKERRRLAAEGTDVQVLACFLLHLGMSLGVPVPDRIRDMCKHKDNKGSE